MASEIERKYLVRSLPDDLRAGPGVALRQGYLAVEGAVEVRVRLTETAARLTVKGGHGRTRTEVEVGIDVAEGEALWSLTEGRRIEKVRHRVELSTHDVVDLDVYAGHLDGLITAEVEFSDDAAADRFIPPAWFGEELTGQRGWSNAALAERGPPMHTDEP